MVTNKQCLHVTFIPPNKQSFVFAHQKIKGLRNIFCISVMWCCHTFSFAGRRHEETAFQFSVFSTLILNSHHSLSNQSSVWLSSLVKPVTLYIQEAWLRISLSITRHQAPCVGGQGRSTCPPWHDGLGQLPAGCGYMFDGVIASLSCWNLSRTTGMPVSRSMCQ